MAVGVTLAFIGADILAAAQACRKKATAWLEGENTCSGVRELTARHVADVQSKIADLRAMERILSEAVRRCDVPSCPLSYRTQASKASVILIAANADHQLVLYNGGEPHLILAE